MYYAIRFIDRNGLDPPETRVPWVNQIVHFWNSVVAWCDIIVAHPRSFSSGDRYVVVLYTVSYSSWLLLIKLITDSFPYPFLNKMPPLFGWCAVCSFGLVSMLSYFQLGQFLKNKSRRRAVH